MAKLCLRKIICHKTDDAKENDQVFDIGIEDEPLLLVNHKRVWSGRMSPNSEEDLSEIQSISFKDQVHMALMERDPGYASIGDEVLGQTTIYAIQANSGEQEINFNKTDSRYTIVYKVE